MKGQLQKNTEDRENKVLQRHWRKALLKQNHRGRLICSTYSCIQSSTSRGRCCCHYFLVSEGSQSPDGSEHTEAESNAASCGLRTAECPSKNFRRSSVLLVTNYGLSSRDYPKPTHWRLSVFLLLSYSLLRCFQ